MDAYSAGTLIRTLAQFFGAKTALAILAAVLFFMASKKTVSWFFDEALSLLRQWVQSQTDEKKQLVAQNQEYARQINTFLTNHLAHVKEEREEHRVDMAARDKTLATLNDSLVKTSAALDETLASCQKHREEDAKAHDKMSRDLLKVKIQIGLGGDDD